MFNFPKGHVNGYRDGYGEGYGCRNGYGYKCYPITLIMSHV